MVMGWPGYVCTRRGGLFFPFWGFVLVLWSLAFCFLFSGIRSDWEEHLEVVRESKMIDIILLSLSLCISLSSSLRLSPICVRTYLLMNLLWNCRPFSLVFLYRLIEEGGFGQYETEIERCTGESSTQARAQGAAVSPLDERAVANLQALFWELFHHPIFKLAHPLSIDPVRGHRR